MKRTSSRSRVSDRTISKKLLGDCCNVQIHWLILFGLVFLGRVAAGTWRYVEICVFFCISGLWGLSCIRQLFKHCG